MDNPQTGGNSIDLAVLPPPQCSSFPHTFDVSYEVFCMAVGHVLFLTSYS